MYLQAPKMEAVMQRTKSWKKEKATLTDQISKEKNTTQNKQQENNELKKTLGEKDKKNQETWSRTRKKRPLRNKGATIWSTPKWKEKGEKPER